MARLELIVDDGDFELIVDDGVSRLVRSPSALPHVCQKLLKNASRDSTAINALDIDNMILAT